MVYTKRPCPKGVPFLCFRYMNFASWSPWKLWNGKKICHFGLYKGPKGLTEAFYGCEKSRKNVLFFKKTVNLRKFSKEPVQISKPRYVKSIPLVNKRYKRGTFSLVRVRVRVWTWGRSLCIWTLLRTPFPPMAFPLLYKISYLAENYTEQ